MSPEDWKTYWRTCHLTPFQVLEMERREESQPAPQLSDDWKQTFRELFNAEPVVLSFWSRDTGRVDYVQACLDSMELQMMGIKP